MRLQADRRGGAVISQPFRPDATVALPERVLGDLLSEELRRLDTDEPYREALEAATGVTGPGRPLAGARARLVRPRRGERRRRPPEEAGRRQEHRVVKKDPPAPRRSQARGGPRRRAMCPTSSSSPTPSTWRGPSPRRWSPGWRLRRRCTGRRRSCSPAAGSASPSSRRRRRWPTTPPRHRVDWTAVDVWWGDERFVPADDDERNEKAARRRAARPASGCPRTRVHAMPPSDGGVRRAGGRRRLVRRGAGRRRARGRGPAAVRRAAARHGAGGARRLDLPRRRPPSPTSGRWSPSATAPSRRRRA